MVDYGPPFASGVPDLPNHARRGKRPHELHQTVRLESGRLRANHRLGIDELQMPVHKEHVMSKQTKRDIDTRTHIGRTSVPCCPRMPNIFPSVEFQFHFGGNPMTASSWWSTEA